MMGFIIYHEDIAGIRHLAQDFACISLVALGTTLVNTAALGNGFFTVPGQGLPVGDHHLSLMQFIQQPDRNDIELKIVVVIAACPQHLQAAFYCQAWGNDEYILGETPILRVGYFVADRPGNQHGHNRGLTAAGAELGADTAKQPAVRRNIDTHLIGGRSFCQPDQRFHCVHLTEKELVLSCFRVIPMRQKLSCYTGDSGIASFPPCLHSGADFVHQR